MPLERSREILGGELEMQDAPVTRGRCGRRGVKDEGTKREDAAAFDETIDRWS